MMCEECELKYGTSNNDMFTYCDCCGIRFYSDDACFVGDEVVCPNCYEKYFRECEKCSEIVHIDDIHFYEQSEMYVCNECFEELNCE